MKDLSELQTVGELYDEAAKAFQALDEEWTDENLNRVIEISNFGEAHELDEIVLSAQLKVITESLEGSVRDLLEVILEV